MLLTSVEIEFDLCGWLGQVPQTRLALIALAGTPLDALNVLLNATRKVKFLKSKGYGL